MQWIILLVVMFERWIGYKNMCFFVDSYIKCDLKGCWLQGREIGHLLLHQEQECCTGPADLVVAIGYRVAALLNQSFFGDIFGEKKQTKPNQIKKLFFRHKYFNRQTVSLCLSQTDIYILPTNILQLNPKKVWKDKHTLWEERTLKLKKDISELRHLIPSSL